MKRVHIMVLDSFGIGAAGMRRNSVTKVQTL